MEKPFRMLLAGVVAGFVLFIVIGLVYQVTGEITDPSIKNLFREHISMNWFYKLLIINVGTGIVMAIFYSMVKRSMPGGSILKGIFFGLMVWSFMVVQILLTYLVAGNFTQVLFISWLIQGLVSYAAAGVSISLIYKD